MAREDINFEQIKTSLKEFQNSIDTNEIEEIKTKLTVYSSNFDFECKNEFLNALKELEKKYNKLDSVINSSLFELEKLKAGVISEIK
ncbi:MAG: hypothetical protein IKE73_03840 [Bacilli bacterium]|nr:hypothetical protein [Bacilli bacterium]